MAESEIRLIGIAGPTASGKTSLACAIAKRFGGEVVSCDSMQIYKDMSIATAAPTEEEKEGVPHHLVEFLSPDVSFSVAEYCELAHDCISRIASSGRVPVVAGGTGLYFDSLLNNIDFSPTPTDLEYRDRLRQIASEQGAGVLLEKLREIDAETASRLHVNDVSRIIRALEIHKTTGKTKTQQDEQSLLSPSRYSPFLIGLDARDREVLYNRINTRVDNMIEGGILDEARRFFETYGGRTSGQAIGYKELSGYLQGTESLDDAVECLKMQTRRYAKRQLTWFRRNKDINWLYIDDYSGTDELLNAAYSLVSEKGGFDEI